MINRLFKAHPHIQDQFLLFKGKSFSDLRNNKKMKAHATSIFYVFTSYVENADDPETLVGLVEKIAVAHVGRGVPVHDFENVRTVFLIYIKSLLGNAWTPEIEQAWDKLLKAHNSIYKKVEDDIKSRK